MRNLLLAIPLLALVACSGSSGSGSSSKGNPTSPEESELVVVEISELGNSSNESYIITEALEFDERTEADPVYNQEMVYRVTNSSDVAIAFTMTQLGDTAARFPIIENECGASLAAKASCEVRIAFDGDGVANGEVHGNIIFAAALVGGIGGIGGTQASENLVSLPLIGRLNISGNELDEDSNDDGETIIALALSAPFTQGGEPIQTITVTNDGDDPAEMLFVEVTGEYSIFANTCQEMLEEGESCQVQVLYDDYQSLDTDTPSQGTLRVGSERSDTYILNFIGGGISQEDG